MLSDDVVVLLSMQCLRICESFSHHDIWGGAGIEFPEVPLTDRTIADSHRSDVVRVTSEAARQLQSQGGRRCPARPCAYPQARIHRWEPLQAFGHLPAPQREPPPANPPPAARTTAIHSVDDSRKYIPATTTHM